MPSAILLHQSHRFFGLCAGMAGTRTMMGRDEFTKLVQSSIQDCQVEPLSPQMRPSLCSLHPPMDVKLCRVLPSPSHK